MIRTSRFVVSIAIALWTISASAEAQVMLGGGATGPSPVYRELMDCHSIQVDGAPSARNYPVGTGFLNAYPISAKCSGAGPTGNVSGLQAQFLYAPVGSGRGKNGLINRDYTQNSKGMGLVGATNTVPFISSYWASYPYPTVRFIASNEPWTPADAANYVAQGGPAKFGKVIQLPSLAGAVAIVVSGYGGWGGLSGGWLPQAAPLNIANPEPAGAIADRTTFGYPGKYSGLNLTRRALCGIFTGHITVWNDPELTAANGGVALGNGQIAVAHREDASGTNYLFTKALYEQCKGVSGPTSTADALSASPHIVSWEFRFPEHSSGACPDLFYRGSSLTDWLPEGGSDACGNPEPYWPGTYFLGNSVRGDSPYTYGIRSDADMKYFVERTVGAIGYASTAFAQPVLATGMQVANIQSQYDLDNGTGAFQWPSPRTVANAMATTNPQFLTDAAIGNPLNWSSQGSAPNPGTPASYPIVGFTWLDIYQCYAQGNTLSTLQNYLGFHYYDPRAAAIINAGGYATIPNAWRDYLIPLLTSSSSGLATTGDPAVPGCTSATPGG